MARNLAISTEFRGFDKMSKPLRNINNKLDKINRRLRKTKNTAKETSSSFIKSFAKMAAGVGIFLVAFRGIRLIKDGLFAATKTASDFFEENQKFGVVFRGLGSEANKMRNTLVKAYNFSRLEATQLLAATGDLLVSQGFTRKESLKMSFALNKLAADRASFTNLEGGAARASRILTKALIGEREGLKAIGLSVNENTQDFKKQLKVGLRVRKGNIDQGKSIATWNIVLRKSSDSIGDMARNQGTFASNSRLMESRLQDFTTEIGEAFLPAMNEMLSMLIKGVVFIGKFATANKVAISNIFISAIQLVISGFSILIKITGVLAQVLIVSGVAFNTIASIMLNGIASLLEAFPELPRVVTKVFGFIVNTISKSFTLIIKAAALFVGAFDEELAKTFKSTGKVIDSMTKKFVGGFQASEDAGFKMAKQIRLAAGLADQRATDLSNTFLKIPNLVDKATVGLEGFSAGLDSLRGAGSSQTNTTIVKPDITDPVGNATPSSTITGTAKIKNELEIKFNNKPDDVEVIQPSGQSDTGLTLAGSG